MRASDAGKSSESGNVREQMTNRTANVGREDQSQWRLCQSGVEKDGQMPFVIGRLIPLIWQ